MDFITKWMTKDERKMGMGQKKEKKKENLSNLSRIIKYLAP